MSPGVGAWPDAEDVEKTCSRREEFAWVPAAGSLGAVVFGPIVSPKGALMRIVLTQSDISKIF